MSTVYIFHGVGGDENENWFPWLRSALEEEGHSVVVPSFPHTNNPQLSEWLEYFSQFQSQLSSDSILIGHSLGAAFAFHLAEKNSVRALLLVAPVWKVMENQYDHLMGSFVGKGFDWEKITRNTQGIQIYHSDNDPYIALIKAEQLADILGVPLEVVPSAGHFNTAAKYSEFPQLLEYIRTLEKE